MSDLYIDITFPIDNPEKYEIKSNVKRDKIKDLLCGFIQDQIGRGEDEGQANEFDVYHITINIDLSDDSFTVKSDTGNKGLTTGIIMDVIGRIE